MKSKKIIIFLIAVFFGVQNVFAQEAQKAQNAYIQKIDLSFEQAYQLMLANNNEIKATLEEVKEKKYERKAAIGHYFPKLGINSTYTRLDDNISVTAPSTAIAVAGLGTIHTPPITMDLQDRDFWLTNVGAVWNVFTGGKILALNSAARAKLEATNEKYKLVTNDLICELVKRYYGLRLAQDVVSVRKQVYETTKKHLEDAKKLEEAGIIPKSEKLHAEVAFANAKMEYEDSIRDRNIVEEGLKTLIKDDNIDLKGVEIIPSSSLFVYSNNFEALEEFKQKALAQNPNLKQLEAKKQLAQANYRSHAANYSPTLSLFAYDTVAKRNMSYQIPSWSVGATVNMVLFDGLSRYNELKAADCVRKQVKYETINAKNNVESLVTKKYEELMKYKEQYESTAKSIESAQEALRTSTLAFNEGMNTSLAVTDAQTAFSGAKVKRLNAIYNYDMALTELLKTNGSAEEILNYIKNSSSEKL